MKVQFNGPEAEATAFGLVFPAGELVEIGGLAEAFQAKLQANPTFTVESAAADDDVSIEDLREQLTARGITFHHKAGVAKLTALLSESDG